MSCSPKTELLCKVQNSINRDKRSPRLTGRQASSETCSCFSLAAFQKAAAVSRPLNTWPGGQGRPGRTLCCDCCDSTMPSRCGDENPGLHQWLWMCSLTRCSECLPNCFSQPSGMASWGIQASITLSAYLHTCVHVHMRTWVCECLWTRLHVTAGPWAIAMCCHCLVPGVRELNVTAHPVSC